MAPVAVFAALVANACWLAATAGSGLGLDGLKKSRDQPQQPIYSMERAALWISTTDSSGAAPSLAEDLPKHVAAFLYTGDSNELRRANCSKRYELSSLSGLSPRATHQSLNSSVELLIHSANFLNMMLQSNKSKEHPAHRDLEWYKALIRSILEGESSILRCAITVNAEPHSHVPQVFLQGTRVEDKILLEDLTSSAHRLPNASQETDWFHTFRHKLRPHHHKRSTNGAKTLEESWKKGTSFITNKSQVRWSSPFLECDQGTYKPNWILTLSAAFYGLKPNLVREFR